MRNLFLLLLLLQLPACQPANNSASGSSATGQANDFTKIVDYNPGNDPRPLSELIQIDGIAAGAVLGSPYTLTGKAKSSWFFEGDFPVRLEDRQGNRLASTYAKAESSRLEPGFNPFYCHLAFIAAPGTEAVLILQLNNPSDGEGYQRAVEIPVILR